MYSGLRILAVATLLLLTVAAPDRVAYKSVAFSLAFSHYTLGLVYSWSRMRAALEHASLWPWLAALAALGVVLEGTDFSLVYYFGIHHVLNEVYMLDRVTRARADPRVRALRAGGIALHASLYVAFLRHRAAFEALEPAWILAALAASYGVYFVLLFRARSVLSRRELFDHLAVELLALPILAMVRHAPLGVLDVAIYHFAFWIWYPCFSMARGGGGSLARYLLAMVGLTAAFLLVSPAAFVPAHFAMGTYQSGFYLVSYIHITLSFAFSDANPAPVNAVFRPRAAGSAPAGA